MKSVFYSAVVFSMAVSSAAFAAPADQGIDANYLTVGQVKVEEIGQVHDVQVVQGLLIDGDIIINLPAPGPTRPTDPTQIPSGIPEIDTAHIVLSKIINMGKMIWDVIAANKPVVNVRTDMASALPFGVNGWENLSSWQTPKVREFRVSYANLYGSKVVDFTFRVLYTHGGNVGGHGAYLANATIIPAHLIVGWGYTFNANSTVVGVMNAGTTEEPVAGMQLQLRWSIDTVLKHEENTVDFYIKGDGSFQALGSSGQVLE